MLIAEETRRQSQDLLHFIDASPSPWHVVSSCESRLQHAGYARLDEKQSWQLNTGGKYYVVRGGSSIIAFVVGQQAIVEAGFRLVGAHTDSPGLRLKPKAEHRHDGFTRIGVEVYGGPILATFSDRDLGLAGRVNVRHAQGFETRLLALDKPLLRLPNLAIHMNREVNEQGLKFNKQTELPLLFGLGQPDQQFLSYVAQQLEVETDAVMSWELCAFDTQKGVFWGADEEFIADSQLDNLASCHAALTALLTIEQPSATCVAAFFDHEEVGSESAAGAGGSFLVDVVQRIVASLQKDSEGLPRALANSFFISADMAHAYHPNFPNAYEPCHRVMVNAGPVIKSNANQRYSTGADSAARFMTICEKAGVPVQQYSHRTDLGCGSTIGPIVASRLGVTSVDVGNPMWAMHSIRESAGVLDHGYMIAAMKVAYQS